MVKKISLLASAAVLGLGLALASCGDSNPIIAEGTGHAEHGMILDMLYQEHKDGTVKIYQTNIYGDSQTLLRFEGTVVKGVDEDGDPLVTLTIPYEAKGCYAIMSDDMAAEMGGSAVSDVTQSYVLEDPITTSTYDASTGNYTMPFEWSLYGYLNLTASIEVKTVSKATDPATWAKAYISNEKILANIEAYPA